MTEKNTVLTPEVKQMKRSDERQIPYPQGMGRWLLRLPLELYRLGLGDVLNLGQLMILGTRGRKSGQPRYTPIEYRQHGSKLYIVSAWGERPQWFRNLQANPEVLVQQGKHQFAARAEVVTNSGETLAVLHLFRRRAPYLYDPLIARMSDRDKIDERMLPDISGQITVVRFDPLDTPSDLPALPADRAWLWPLALALTILALVLLIAGKRSRRPR
ncbi:MAG TPA: nitroreductase family deazaflavin-dependent oxidoreductase [Phototrophicaceae bacterium]|nr:nitroreductase family deazaflavin-dependent oxidoreductase [Phototrophicaceae bacterium]